MDCTSTIMDEHSARSAGTPRHDHGPWLDVEDVLDAAGVGGFAIDVTTQALVVDERARSLLGLPVTGTLRAADMVERVHPDDRRAVLDVLLELTTESRGSFAFRAIERGSDLRWLSARCYRRSSRASQDLIVGALTDITEERRRTGLGGDRTLYYLGLAVSEVARSSGEMLTLVKSCAGLARSNEPTNAASATDAWLDEIEAATAAHERAIEALLEACRPEPLRRSEYTAESLLRTSEPRLRRRLRDTQALRVRVHRSALVGVDAELFEQALEQLVSNAAEAAPGDATIGIELTVVEQDTRRSTLPRELSPGEYAVVTVVDGGPGMSPEVRIRAVAPHFTTKRDARHSGLGLPLCRIIASMHAGTLVLDGEGPGTRISLLLPCRSPVPKPSAADEAESTSQPYTVLVVEDEFLVRKLTTRILRGAGYRVLEAAGPEAALALALSDDESVDLIVSDVRMPGSSGPDLVRRLRALRPSIAALFVSGYATEILSEEGHLGSEVPLLAKPFLPEELLEHARRALAARPSRTGASSPPSSSLLS